jgi:hypothetical protein
VRWRTHGSGIGFDAGGEFDDHARHGRVEFQRQLPFASYATVPLRCVYARGSLFRSGRNDCAPPIEEKAMIRKKAAAIGGVLALALAVAPISPAFAGDRHHGGYGHGGGHGGYGYGYGFNPVVGLATALVGVAAAIVTAPIAILAAAARAPYYGPGPGYSAAPAAYDAPPVARGYYGAPAAPVPYGSPATDAAYYGPPPVTYYSPPPVTYYSPPVATYYGAPAAAYYASPPGRGYYAAPGRGYYAAPGRGYYGPQGSGRDYSHYSGNPGTNGSPSGRYTYPR